MTCYGVCFLFDFLFWETSGKADFYLSRPFWRWVCVCMSGGGWLEIILSYDWSQEDPALSGLCVSGLCISQHCLPWCVGLILSRDSIHGRRDSQNSPKPTSSEFLIKVGKVKSRDILFLLGFIRMMDHVIKCHANSGWLCLEHTLRSELITVVRKWELCCPVPDILWLPLSQSHYHYFYSYSSGKEVLLEELIWSGRKGPGFGVCYQPVVWAQHVY